MPRRDTEVKAAAEGKMTRGIPNRRSATALRRAREGSGIRTILVALLANVAIAIAKVIGGLISGSTGMLAEAAHSAADSVNEIFLALGLHRDRQPADEEHPFGHGRERFLWAFMAAIASFLIGGCLSIALAVAKLKTHEPVSGGFTAWIVLGVAFVAEGASSLQSVRQARQQAKEYQLTMWAYIARTSDPVVRAILVEDSAALVGLCIAAGGLLLSELLGTSVPDSIASLIIGVLLAVTAFGLAWPFADFLVGRSLPPREHDRLHWMVKNDKAIEEIVSLRAIYSGPEEVLVMAKVHPSAHMSIKELAVAMDDLDHRIRLALPYVADVFIDFTATRD